MIVEKFGRKYHIEVFENVYYPAEDTFLLLDNVKVHGKILDMGTGCGIIAIANSYAKEIEACDINPYAIKNTLYNIELNGIKNVEVFYSDLFENINERYDFILFNPPYLPSLKNEKRDYLTIAWDGGGRYGRRIIDRFINEVYDYLKFGGKVYIINSSINRVEKTLKMFRKNRMKARILKEVSFFFEKLYLIEATK